MKFQLFKVLSSFSEFQTLFWNCWVNPTCESDLLLLFLKSAEWIVTENNFCCFKLFYYLNAPFKFLIIFTI